MAASKAKAASRGKGNLISHGRVAENRKARFDYEILETIEAGLVLTSSEVKSLRGGQASIGEAYAADRKGRLVLMNAHIAEYPLARENHVPTRHRGLLLKKREMARLLGHINKDGMSLVPLRLYFNSRGIAKLALGLAKGKRRPDKRESIKRRDLERRVSRGQYDEV